jgi:hypothetical protein
MNQERAAEFYAGLIEINQRNTGISGRYAAVITQAKGPAAVPPGSAAIGLLTP